MVQRAGFVRRVRTFRTSDAANAVEFIDHYLPVPKRLAGRLPGLLSRLVDEEVLRGVVVEYIQDRDVSPEFAAFGLSGFLREEFVADYLASPTPHLFLTLLDLESEGMAGRTLLNYDEIAHANAGAGLTLDPFMWLQRSYDITDPEARDLLVLGQQTFLDRHRGYRVARILKEAPAWLASSYLGGGFKEQHRFWAGTPLSFFPGTQLKEDYVLFNITRAGLEGKLPTGGVEHLFTYQPPRCGFTRAEHQVLTRAVEGLTDAKIAQDLDAPVNTITMRWRSIYARVAANALDVPMTEESTNGARGQERRRLVIAFLQEHPEELRPYARPGRGHNGSN